jgi:phage terminase large subunit GpA-like protein
MTAASLRERFPGLADGRAAFLKGFQRGVRPPHRLSVPDWAEKHRVVGKESGSPVPGAWRTSLVPYLREVMEVLDLSHPSTEVVAKKCNQVAFTEAGVNLLGSVIHQEPSPILVLLPSIDEVSKYVKVKIQPTVDETPVLEEVVRPQKSRDGEASTQSMLRFAGGYAVIDTASSSKPFQMVSYRIVILEEVSEYPFDVGGRGDPVDLAYSRTRAWRETRGAKLFYNSTPGIDGVCRISAKYEVSDQRRIYVPCPHCGAFQVLKWENLRFEAVAPYGAHFVCLAADCGGVIEHHHKQSMLAAHRWIKTYPGDEDNPAPPSVIQPEDMDRWRARGSANREPGFALWQAYSPFATWDGIAKDFHDAKRGGPEKMKVFTQQTLGEPWKEKGEAPDADKLFERRSAFPTRQIPVGAHVLTGFCDVQNDRLQWAVYAWGPGAPGTPTGWRIDGGTIAGDPEDDDVWTRLDAVIGRRYRDSRGASWPIQAFGVDTGYLSHRVYLFCRRRPGVFACDGRGGGTTARLLPPIGQPTKVDVNWGGRKISKGCLLWPIGTWPMKSAHYAALRRTIRGPDVGGGPRPGSLQINEDIDLGGCKQLTAESLKITTRNGKPHQEWVRHGANEELDCAVGARALAYHLGADKLSPDDWVRIAAQQAAVPVQDATLFDVPIGPAPTAAAKVEDDGERRSPDELPVREIDPVEPPASRSGPRAHRQWLGGGRKGGGAWLKPR